MTVVCEKKAPSELVFTPFQTINGILNGGNSGTCNFTMPSDGSYDFRASVSSGSGSSSSEIVTVVLASAAPSTPLDYDRDGSSCNVTFTTANDGLTSKVELYRSLHDTFTADASTFSTFVNIAPNTNGSLSDPLGNCGDYYYAIRAVSAAGVGSGFVGDEDVNVETTTNTNTTTNETIVRTGGAIPVEGGTVAGETTVETPAEEGAVQGETTENGNLTPEEIAGAETEKTAGVFGGKNAKYWWIAAAFMLGLAYYAYRKLGKNNPNPPLNK